MNPSPKSASASLFQVYLRLRPPPSPLVQLTPQSLYPLLAPPERYLTVEPATHDDHDDARDCRLTQITIHPPSDSRRRAVEKFAFTKVFEEEASQMDIFKGAGVVPLIEGVVGEGRDGLLATLGVTGSGKSHTILGSRSQRGLTQLSLDLLYRSLDTQTLHPSTHPTLISSLSAADASEGQILSASSFLDGVYGDGPQDRNNSRAATPMMVGDASSSSSAKAPQNGLYSQWSILGLGARSLPLDSDCSRLKPTLRTVALASQQGLPGNTAPSSLLPIENTSMSTRKHAKIRFGNDVQDPSFVSSVPKRSVPQRPSALPQFPDISDLSVTPKANTEYAVLVSMYEVYNDRIFDLLSHPRNLKDLRRRPLLFKPTETSPDRKLVAGLRKVVCSNYEEALMVLETGLMERRVAGTGSNSVSSRSHGFFCVEVKRRPKGGMSASWGGAQLTIVDLAGSERARNAKTAGATLAEAGKINESLMYLGQCLQMQSDCHDGTKPSIVPFRQCKLTELLFSNSFPSSSHHPVPHHQQHHRNPQKAIMIVTADPLGDFNATSQILRYSALAREVTVPRIPSVSSTILSGNTTNLTSSKSQLTSGRTSPNSVVADEAMVEMAFSEIARLTEEVNILAVQLAEEQGRRREAEEGWQRAEQKAEDIEQVVREECWGAMERKLEDERRRWISAWGEEADRNDEHIDRKLDILTQGIQIHEDVPSPNQERQDLQAENERLRCRLDNLERELQSRSPTRSAKTKQQQTPSAIADCGTTLFKLNSLSLNHENSLGSPTKTPGKKMKKLTMRKMDLGDENELDGYDAY